MSRSTSTLQPGVICVPRPQRPGQDQSGRGDRLRRDAVVAPGRDRPAAGAARSRSGDRPDARCSRDDREALIELEINPGKANRARLNRGTVPRARDALGILRTVLFSPDDLELVKGDPSCPSAVPRRPAGRPPAAVRGRALRLRPGAEAAQYLAQDGGPPRRRSAATSRRLATLDSWDAHIAQVGAELLAARLDLVAALRPPVSRHYAAVAESVAEGRRRQRRGLTYRASLDVRGESEREALESMLVAELARRRTTSWIGE